MRFIGSGLPELFHNNLARIDDTHTLFCNQCRGGARAYELIVMIVSVQGSEGGKKGNKPRGGMQQRSLSRRRKSLARTVCGLSIAYNSTTDQAS